MSPFSCPHSFANIITPLKTTACHATLLGCILIIFPQSIPASTHYRIPSTTLFISQVYYWLFCIF